MDSSRSAGLTTIMDVAARAGVSMKTVSRVLNGEPHVRIALQDRVKRAAAELGYQPRLAARQLAGNRSFLIAYLMPRINVSYQSALILAAAAECHRFGYHLVPETFKFWDEDDKRRGVEDIISRLRPDGILLTPPQADDPDVILPIERAGIPLARIATASPGYGHAIAVDDTDVSRKLVEHLVAQGHRRIAHIMIDTRHHAAASRAEGYRAALSDAGLPIDSELILPGDNLFYAGVHAADRLLALPDPPTAIFAGTDGMALGVMAAAQRRGLTIPDDLAVAGFDDTPAGRMTWPPLTSVRQPFEDMARLAIALLLGKEPPTAAPQYELRIRGSTSGSRDYAADAVEA